ncbi:Hypothetical_protein [Hexamita inflata]|uniref:Hypothetical_protein n=1 Tax=Hexamita inflata TaxID=28002 RepID=A0ABP1I6A9_9EUKA
MQFITSSASTGPAEDLVFIFNWVNLNDLGISQSRKTMEDFFFQSQPGAQDEVLVLRLIRIIIQVVTVAFILNIQIMNAFLFLEEWNQVGQSGPALNNILMLLQNNSYFLMIFHFHFIMRNQFS